MLESDEVSAILRLNELGWGSKRIARATCLSFGRSIFPIKCRPASQRAWEYAAGQACLGEDQKEARHRGNEV